MKRFICIILSAVLLLSYSVPCLAEDNEEHITQWVEVPLSDAPEWYQDAVGDVGHVYFPAPKTRATSYKYEHVAVTVSLYDPASQVSSVYNLPDNTINYSLDSFMQGEYCSLNDVLIWYDFFGVANGDFSQRYELGDKYTYTVSLKATVNQSQNYLKSFGNFMIRDNTSASSVDFTSSTKGTYTPSTLEAQFTLDESLQMASFNQMRVRLDGDPNTTFDDSEPLKISVRAFKMEQKSVVNGLLETIIAGITSLPGLIIDGFSNLLKALFIPSEDFLVNKINEFAKSLEAHLGFLAFPVTVINDLLQAALAVSDGDGTFTFPAIQFEQNGQMITLSDEYNIDLNDTLTAFPDLQKYLRLASSFVLLLLVVARAIHLLRHYFGEAIPDVFGSFFANIELAPESGTMFEYGDMDMPAGEMVATDTEWGMDVSYRPRVQSLGAYMDIDPTVDDVEL